MAINPSKEERAVAKAAFALGFKIDPNRQCVEEKILRDLYDEAWSNGFQLGVGDYDMPMLGAGS
jgi:hypothetical protein